MEHVLVTLSRQTRLFGGHPAGKHSAIISVSSHRRMEALFSKVLLANLKNPWPPAESQSLWT